MAKNVIQKPKSNLQKIRSIFISSPFELVGLITANAYGAYIRACKDAIRRHKARSYAGILRH